MTAVSPVLTSTGVPIFDVGTRDGVDAVNAGASGHWSSSDGNISKLGDRRPSCAVSRSENAGGPRVSGVRPDRFDHEVEFVGAVDLARHTAGFCNSTLSPTADFETDPSDFDSQMNRSRKRNSLSFRGSRVRIWAKTSIRAPSTPTEKKEK
jgi:hypothetical protein